MFMHGPSVYCKRRLVKGKVFLVVVFLYLEKTGTVVAGVNKLVQGCVGDCLRLLSHQSGTLYVTCHMKMNIQKYMSLGRDVPPATCSVTCGFGVKAALLVVLQL